MKKIQVILLAIVLPMVAIAQPSKVLTDAQKVLDKAYAASQDAKKATKAATWQSLSDAYVKAFDAPIQNLLAGTAKSEVDIFLKGQTPISTSEKEGAEGTTYTVVSYADKDLYYRDNTLDFWIVTKPVDADALTKAMEALEKAYSLDPKAATNKDYAVKAQSIHDNLYTEALYTYLSGNTAKAGSLFENTAKVSEGKIINAFDSLSTYYSGLMAAMAGDADKAMKLYITCSEKGFYNDGTVFSNLAEIYKAKGDVAKARSLLEEGFAKFPNSQPILVGLINHYLETNAEPSKLFDLLHAAQANDPKNASLYYVEGDANRKLGNDEQAVALFEKSTAIDPTYIYGVLNIGILYYDKAVEISEKASQEMDDAKYNVLLGELNSYLEKAISPFERSFNLTDDQEIKMAVADYLKNIYFRFRDKGADYQTAYDKYNNFVKGE